ncbi:MAG: hypothetical protein L0H86_12155, partial [Micrococcaceae bacterium]|nr:hypothetical protein [Micrococcaceae bacterium]
KVATDDNFRKEYEAAPEKCLEKYEIKVSSNVQAELPKKQALVDALKSVLESTLAVAPSNEDLMTLRPQMPSAQMMGGQMGLFVEGTGPSIVFPSGEVFVPPWVKYAQPQLVLRLVDLQRVEKRWSQF